MTDPDDVVQAAEHLLRTDALTRSLVNVLHRELFVPARELFGDRAVPWIASTLRTTAELLERMGDGDHIGA